jgi:hypothetical protein
MVECRPKVKDYRVTILHEDSTTTRVYTDDVDEARALWLNAKPGEDVETDRWDDYLGAYVETDSSLGDW